MQYYLDSSAPDNLSSLLRQIGREKTSQIDEEEKTPDSNSPKK